MATAIQSHYSLTPAIWPGSGIIEIFDPSSIVENGELVDESGVNINCSLKPEHGRYFYVRKDGSKTAFTPVVGPRLHHRHRGPIQDSDSGTMSASSATGSSGNQSAFRSRLLIRDGWCIVSEEAITVAAHILPQSRPEYYEEILGYKPSSLHEVGFGILLSGALHHSFDQAEWSLFPNPEGNKGDYIVHVFYNTNLRHFHGKEIKRARFRIKDDIELPREDFIRFHYRQCILKHIRGFSYFPPLN